MAVDIDTIGIAADTKDLQRGKRDLDEFGRSADKASRQADDFGKKTKTGVDSASSSMLSFGKAAGVAYAAYSTFTRLASAADTYTKITAQLKIATKSQEEYNTALADVKRIASTAQADIESVNKLYVRLTGSLSELGVEQKRIADISETVALALKVEGAEASAVSSVMLQLSQGFASGVLRGDEFNSMAENSQTLMKALAASMGVTTGALRDMASEGLITREVMLKAFGDTKLLENLRTQASEINTISGAWQKLRNEITLSVGELNKATGASNLFIKSMDALSGFIGKDNPFQAAGKIANTAMGGFTRFFMGSNYIDPNIAKQEEKRRADAAKNGIFGSTSPITGGGSYSPNFSSTVAVQDVNKIHQRQEELARKNAEIAQKYADKAKEAAEKAHDADVKRKLGALELYWDTESRRLEEYTDKKETFYKYETKLRKELEDKSLKHLEAIERSENKLAKERLDAAEKLAKKQEEAAKELNKSITDALLRGFESGKSSAQNFKETLINMFKTMVLRPAISFLIDSSGLTKVLGGLGGLFSGNASAGTSSIFSSGGDIISTLKNGFSSVNDSFIEGIAGFGTTLRDFGFDGLGTLIENNSTMLGNIAPWAGAAIQLAQGNVGGAVGTALGTAIGGPIGGAIGSFLGGALGGMFGKKERAKIFSSTSNQVYSGGEIVSLDNTPYASGRRFKSLGADTQVNSLNEMFAKSLGGFLAEFDLSDTITSQAVVSARKKQARGVFNASFGSGGSYNYNVGGDGNAQDAFNKMADAVLSEGIISGIKQSGLSEGIKKFFDDLDTKEQVSDAMSTLVQMRDALVDLPTVFNAIRNAIDTTSYTTTIEQLKSIYNATQTYTSLFYTAQENFATYTAQLTTQFDKLNTSLPATRDAYRQLVDGINVVDEASRDQFAGLVALAPAMDAYFKQLEQQADGINQVNQALADGLDRNLFSTYADYASARASVANGLGTNGFVGELSAKKAQGEADLVNAVKSLVAQQARTDQILAEIADATRRTREINERWNGDGLPETRVI